MSKNKKISRTIALPHKLKLYEETVYSVESDAGRRCRVTLPTGWCCWLLLLFWLVMVVVVVGVLILCNLLSVAI